MKVMFLILSCFRVQLIKMKGGREREKNKQGKQASHHMKHEFRNLNFVHFMTGMNIYFQSGGNDTQSCGERLPQKKYSCCFCCHVDNCRYLLVSRALNSLSFESKKNTWYKKIPRTTPCLSCTCSCPLLF